MDYDVYNTVDRDAEIYSQLTHDEVDQMNNDVDRNQKEQDNVFNERSKKRWN